MSASTSSTAAKKKAAAVPGKGKNGIVQAASRFRPRKIKAETRHDKFRRLGVSRMNRVLTSLRLLSQLSSANYKYTAADSEIIEKTLTDAVTITLAKFKRIQQDVSVH